MKYLFTILFAFITLVLDAQNFTNTTPFLDSSAQTVDEIYFKFRITDQIPIEKLTRIISLDDFNNGICFAYANQKEFSEFKKLGIEYEVLPNPGDLLKDPKMLDSVDVKGILAWDFYPTYTAYVDMMYQFASNYPNLCQVFSIGTTVNGRELLMARISDNIALYEAEPQFLYTGTIHGDETTGYILLLRLIDYLLVNYGTNAKVTNLVNNIEIWINPLANPDGTYYGGNSTVIGATRYNANGVDLNRNYPDPQDGQHPDGKAWQPETIAFMQLAENNHFVMSANTHGGTEVLNYPWDTWPQLAADNTWWVNVCRQYVDTVHLYSPLTYLDGFDNGITNGYDWYTISGGRQDYMNYFHHCREVTMELSNTKLLPTNKLINHWNWNYRSLLNYIEQSIYGVAGIVTDSLTGLPLKAKVEILGHDIDESFVYSSAELGYYHRLLAPGTYDFTFTAAGSPSKTIKNVQVVKNQTTILDVQINQGYLMKNGTIEVCAGNFYDAGGQTGNYSNSEDFVFTIKPASPQNRTRVQFLSFDVQSQASCSYDYLSIFDGTTISAPIFGKYCGTNSPGTFTAINAEGALTFRFQSNASTTRPGWNAQISCIEYQTIPLVAGWNGLSSFILPENSSLETMFSDILDKIVIVQNEDGFFFPNQNINTLGNWNPEKGYQIKMLNNLDLDIVGTSNTGISINLNQGWNLIPVPSSQQVAVADVIGEISQKVIIIKESTGDQVYWPVVNIITLQNLQPGKSYLIKVTEPVTITFPN